ncbi:putative integral membrane family protein [Rosellinia necatrix]|uniref:Putative integral membrane family protein n=1 Tax=Rosellinia necatrix TaxID=77044 RepID=A0A1W2TAN9_ROSNE|nr:putative integral membrane family protein [Rosellinia necatrix]
MAPQDPNAPTDSNGIGLLITAVVTLSISWLSVALRTYVRAGLIKSFQVDDWVMLAGLANFTVSCSFIFAGLYYGLGRHNKSLSQHDEIEALKYQALATASYVSNMWLIKLSIGLFLFRLAARERYRYILGASIAVVGIWSLALFFWNIFQCSPVPAQWDYTILERVPGSRCVSVDEIVNAAYALSALTILSDWLYALLPIPMIWHVKMTVQAKWSVIAVLSLGVFASIATLIRLGFLADITDVSDILHAGTQAMIWTLVEPGIAISAASLATIRPLLRRWRIRGFTHSERSRATSARSQDQGSRLRRASKMPGFGAHDVTLVDMEPGTAAAAAAAAARGSTWKPGGGIGAGPPSTNTTSKPASAYYKTSHLPKTFVDPSSSSSPPPSSSSSMSRQASSARRAEAARSESFILDGGALSPRSIAESHATVPGAWLDQESDGSTVELNRFAQQTGYATSPR